ncbi:dicarboxylate transporter/tellurite-resistance protein TehA [Paraburkholderia guartelaensis]|uniref:dicarboxylate transporter/tellurite-resistance protein TehA n=1 Tax=Paraburkholderia guartelaensis TaxID=2546446 RepID=UPI002AB7E90A|nr:dicarboxylate transporter/tellurite-resistance protein TehA [Paraburkholderia guartelaensis]
MEIVDQRRPRSMPVSFFSIAVGSLALANAWRVAERLWHWPHEVSGTISVVGLLVWGALLVAYARKWATHPTLARAELDDPLQSSFAALVPVSSLLAALTIQPFAPHTAMALFIAATIAQLGLGLFLHGRIWKGGRESELITTAVYLPVVAPGFVAASAAAAFGWPHVASLFFGAALLSWLAIESMVLHLATVNRPTPEPRRPLLGIQIAPPVVGGVAYLNLTGGTPDLIAYAMLGYGIYQALLLLRLLPWIRRQAFAPSYWAFSFGLAALPTMAMRMAERDATGVVGWLAISLFVVANGVIAVLTWKTSMLAARGSLLPPVAVPHAVSAYKPGRERTMPATISAGRSD